MIIVASYAAGQSAYNMIEHAGSPLSNRLTSVKLPVILDCEDKPPNKQSDLSDEERAQKERIMLDIAGIVACLMAMLSFRLLFLVVAPKSLMSRMKFCAVQVPLYEISMPTSSYKTSEKASYFTQNMLFVMKMSLFL